jgi:phosphonate transport system permease protein
VPRATVAAAATLAVASWAYLFVGQGADPRVLFSEQTWSEGWGFLRKLLGISGAGRGNLAFFDLTRWRDAGGLAYETLAMSVLAIGISTLGMLLTVVPAGRMHDGKSSPMRTAAFILVRGSYIFSRGVPELLWALVIVFVLTPGIFAGALALAIHNYGILSKLCAEVLEDMDQRPLRALRAAGASGPQLLFYGVIPQALPQFLTYMLYRWEVVARTTIVVGFVAAGGLGREFRLSMAFFHYTDVALLLIVYFILVIAVDGVSMALRRMAR